MGSYPFSPVSSGKNYVNAGSSTQFKCTMSTSGTVNSIVIEARGVDASGSSVEYPIIVGADNTTGFRYTLAKNGTSSSNYIAGPTYYATTITSEQEEILRLTNGWQSEYSANDTFYFWINAEKSDYGLKEIKITLNTTDSGSSGDGSDEPDEPGDSGDSENSEIAKLEITWPENFLFKGPKTIQFNPSITVYQTCTFAFCIYKNGSNTTGLIYMNSGQYLYSGDTYSEKFSYTFSSAGKYKVEIVAISAYNTSETVIISQEYEVYTEMGSIETFTVSTNYGNNQSGISFSNVDSSLIFNWSLPSTNGNEIIGYQLYKVNNSNDILIYSGLQQSYKISNILNSDITEFYVKAIPNRSDVAEVTSNIITIYSAIFEPQTYIEANPVELTSKNNSLIWEKPNTNLNLPNLTYSYEIQYERSSDGKTWKDNYISLGTSTTESLTLDASSFLNDFFLFKIITTIEYNGVSKGTISTLKSQNFIKFSGIKPNQLKSLEFFAVNNLLNNTKKSVWDGNIWTNLQDYCYLINPSIIKVNFGDPVFNDGIKLYTPGIRIEWTRGTYKGDIELFADSIDSVSHSFELNENLGELFWNKNIQSPLALRIYAVGKLTKEDGTIITVVKDDSEPFFPGISGNINSLQIAKLPIIEKDAIVTPKRGIVDVNFSESNKQPIIDLENNIYEDLRIENLKYYHPQNDSIDLYGFKVYAKINEGQYQLIRQQLLEEKNGEGSFENNIYIPSNFNPIIGENLSDNNLYLGLNILGTLTNRDKKTHIDTLLGTDVSTYTEPFNISYKITVIDEYGNESDLENSYEYNFIYDCRKSSEFFNAPEIYLQSNIDENLQELQNIYNNPRKISPYNEDIYCISVKEKNNNDIDSINDSVYFGFYPGFKQSDYNNNSNKYVVINEQKYLLDGQTDPNIYYVYKFVKTINGWKEPKIISILTPEKEVENLIKTTKEIQDENNNTQIITYYLYRHEFQLDDHRYDEIAYYQILPAYTDANGIRLPRLYCDIENNLNKFNVIYNGNNNLKYGIPFWCSRIVFAQVQASVIERLAITKDNFGFKNPKLGLYVKDWGATNQFYSGKPLLGKNLEEYNNFNSIKYIVEYQNNEGELIEENNTWHRNYPINYNILATEYNYANWKDLYTDLDNDYKDLYSEINGENLFENPYTGNIIYINLKTPIAGTSAASQSFKAQVKITNTIDRFTTDNNGNSYYGILTEEVKSEDNIIYIAQNNKTFIITENKIGINQPDIGNVSETFYIIGKQQTDLEKNYKNIIGIESSNASMINGKIGAYIGFYDNSNNNQGERVLAGSIGFCTDPVNSIILEEEVLISELLENYNLTLDQFNKLNGTQITQAGVESGSTYSGDFYYYGTRIPYIHYKDGLTDTEIHQSLALIGENGIYVGENGKIGHTNIIEKTTIQNYYPITFDEQGHITSHGNALEIFDLINETNMEEEIILDSAAGTKISKATLMKQYLNITYGVDDPSSLGAAKEGDIYLWIQSSN